MTCVYGDLRLVHFNLVRVNQLVAFSVTNEQITLGAELDLRRAGRSPHSAVAE